MHRVAQQTDRVVEIHGLDVERTQNGRLVDQILVRGVTIDTRDDRAHVAELNIRRTQQRTTIRRALLINQASIFISNNLLKVDNQIGFLTGRM